MSLLLNLGESITAYRNFKNSNYCFMLTLRLTKDVHESDETQL